MSYEKGTNVHVYWKDDDIFYPGTITACHTDSIITVTYFDHVNEEPEKINHQERTILPQDDDQVKYHLKNKQKLLKTILANSNIIIKKGMVVEDGLQANVDSRISVYWPTEKEFFNGNVKKCKFMNGNPSSYYIEYDDGDSQWKNLMACKFNLLGKKKKSSTSRSSSSITELLRKNILDTDIDTHEGAHQSPIKKKKSGAKRKKKLPSAIFDTDDEYNGNLNGDSKLNTKTTQSTAKQKKSETTNQPPMKKKKAAAKQKKKSNSVIFDTDDEDDGNLTHSTAKQKKPEPKQKNKVHNAMSFSDTDDDNTKANAPHQSPVKKKSGPMRKERPRPKKRPQVATSDTNDDGHLDKKNKMNNASASSSTTAPKKKKKTSTTTPSNAKSQRTTDISTKQKKKPTTKPSGLQKNTSDNSKSHLDGVKDQAFPVNAARTSRNNVSSSSATQKKSGKFLRQILTDNDGAKDASSDLFPSDSEDASANAMELKFFQSTEKNIRDANTTTEHEVNNETADSKDPVRKKKITFDDTVNIQAEDNSSSKNVDNGNLSALLRKVTIERDNLSRRNADSTRLLQHRLGTINEMERELQNMRGRLQEQHDFPRVRNERDELRKENGGLQQRVAILESETRIKGNTINNQQGKLLSAFNERNQLIAENNRLQHRIADMETQKRSHIDASRMLQEMSRGPTDRREGPTYSRVSKYTKRT